MLDIELTMAIEDILREFAKDCFKYCESKIDGTDLGIAQTESAIAIKDLFKK